MTHNHRTNIFTVIQSICETEKSTLISADDYVTLRVAKDANKQQVAEAVETLFSVNVLAVKTLNVKGEQKRTRYGTGMSKQWKKAYVKLSEGQQLDIAKLNEGQESS